MQQVFSLGAGASEEAGVPVASKWIDNFGHDRVLGDSLSKQKVLEINEFVRKGFPWKGHPFDTGDDDDGETLVKALSLVCLDPRKDLDLILWRKALATSLAIDPKVALLQILGAINRATTISESSKVGYLQPLVRYASYKTARESRLFSLNYDNSIELAAENMGYFCLTLPGQTFDSQRVDFEPSRED